MPRNPLKRVPYLMKPDASKDKLLGVKPQHRPRHIHNI